MYNVRSEMVMPFRQTIRCGECDEELENCGAERLDCYPPIGKYFYRCPNPKCDSFHTIIESPERYPIIKYKFVKMKWED